MDFLFPDDPISGAFCGVIVIWFSIFIIKSVTGRAMVKLSISKLIKELSKPNTDVSLVTEADYVVDKVKKDPMIKFSIVSFRNSLLEYKKEDKQKHLCNTKSADDFFNEHSLASDYFEVKPITPTLLTALGVLGTFVGLLFCLRDGFDFSSITGGDTDPKKIVDQIQKILAGAGIAFVTSIWGVFFSLISNVYLRKANTTLRTKIRVLSQTLDSIFPPNVSSEFELRNIGAEDSSVQSCILQLGKTLAYVIENSADTTASKISDAITDHIKKINENSAEIIKETLNRVNDTISANIKEQAEATKEAGQAFVDATALATENIRKEFESCAVSIRQELFNVAEETSKLLNSSSSDLVRWGEISKSLSDNADAITTKLGDIFSKVTSISQELTYLSDGMTSRQNDLSDAIESIANNSVTYKDSIEKTAAAISSMDVYVKNISQAAEEMKSLKDYVDGTLRENMNEYSHHVATVTEGLTAKWGETLTDAMQKMSDGLKVITQG